MPPSIVPPWRRRGRSLLLVAATAVSVGLAVWAKRESDPALEQQVLALDRERMAVDAVERFLAAVADEPELRNTPALDGPRDEKERARLPEEGRAAFKQLWDDDDRILVKATTPN